MSNESIKTELIKKALVARKQSYSPYSNFCVGAAVLTDENIIFTGCNVENASYGATICAERNAIFKAVSEGARLLKAIAIVGGLKDEEISNFAYPCGICRQVMREFSDPSDFVVIVAISEDNYKEYVLNDLLPDSFGPELL